MKDNEQVREVREAQDVQENKDVRGAENIIKPLLALRGMAIFPGVLLHFDVGRRKSILAINAAMKEDQEIFLVAQRDLRDDEPAPENLYTYGTVSRVKQILHLPGESVRVLVEGVYRAKSVSVEQEDPYFEARLERCDPTPLEISNSAQEILSESLIRRVQEMIGEYSELGPKLPQDVLAEIMASSDMGALADYIAANIFMKLEDKQAVLQELNIEKRLILAMDILEREIQILEIEQDISEKVRAQVEKNQREYYIREQIKVLSGELGEADSPADEAVEYHKKIDRLSIDEESTKKMHAEADRLMKMPAGSHEATVVRTWLDTCLALPWNKETKDKADLAHAKKVLDQDHYGLEKVKDRILEFLAVKQLTEKVGGQIICLVGPPGVGKTSIARSIAKAMGRKYVRVSLGGVRDEADIRGHRKTYIGAMPGRIINALTLAGTKNPLMLLDEVDKLASDFRGDPASALLEVLDSEQNFAFRDHFIEIPFDLSQVLFITTANDVETIPEPLYDRMEVIPLSSYTREEKFQIAVRHLVAKQLKINGLNRRKLKIGDDAVYALIDFYTRESGVRGLERQIGSLCRKAAKQLTMQGKKSVTITAKDLEALFGPKKFRPESVPAKDEVGLVTGLAWTSVGGETMPIEVCVLDGTGKIELTGSLGDVMKESAHAAISFIRSRSREYEIEPDFYKNKDIHIHVPEGAIPKDGPSAGITMATALVSALTSRPVHHEIAMTGEITLRGRVLPIGGLREKTMAAYRAGVTKVIIPEENAPDLVEVDKVVREHIDFVTADNMDEVLRTALIYSDTAAAKKSREGEGAALGPIPVKESARRPVITQ